MTKSNGRLILLLMICLIVVTTTKAQQFKTNTEIGILGGGSYYLGDLNTTHFHQSLAATGLIIRQNIDKRFVYKAEIMYLNLRSDERESEDTIAKDRGLHFKSPLYEISGQLEFNFLPYQPGNPLYTWTPFVFTVIRTRCGFFVLSFDFAGVQTCGGVSGEDSTRRSQIRSQKTTISSTRLEISDRTSLTFFERLLHCNGEDSFFFDVG